MKDVALAVGVGAETLKRWRAQAQSGAVRTRTWTAGSRLEAVIATAPMAEVDRSVWCREHGVFPVELEKWRASATAALAEPEEARASPQATRQDRKRIKELERDLLRKDRSFARVLRANGQTTHRGRAREPHAVRPPTTHIATAPRQVWCWDMTYLPATVMGRWLRLWLSSFAYALIEALRRLALQGTDLANATAGSIRLKLLKIGAVITLSVRRVKVAMSSAFPLQALFDHAFHALSAAAR